MAQRKHAFDIVSPFRQGELHHKPIENKDETWPVQHCTNPAGYSFEMVMVYNATSLQLVGSPSLAATWFPGYAWTIATCAPCEQFVGWYFTASNPSELEEGEPESFWALIVGRSDPS
jgi:hypothetical protein